MTINTAKTLFEGRTYEVVAHSDRISEPFHSYVQIYRLRKDGSRGKKLLAWRDLHWSVWSTVKNEIKAKETA